MLLQGAGLAKPAATSIVCRRAPVRPIARPALGLLLCLALLPAGCGPKSTAKLAVTEAWVRLPVLAGRPGAAYFTVSGGPTPVRLVAVESPLAGRIELHEGGMSGGHMTMRRLDGVDLAPGGTVTFKPGGNHAMVFAIKPAVTAGGMMRLAFRFEKGEPLVTDAKVVAADGDDPF